MVRGALICFGLAVLSAGVMAATADEAGEFNPNALVYQLHGAASAAMVLLALAGVVFLLVWLIRGERKPENRNQSD